MSLLDGNVPGGSLHLTQRFLCHTLQQLPLQTVKGKYVTWDLGDMQGATPYTWGLRDCISNKLQGKTVFEQQGRAGGGTYGVGAGGRGGTRLTRWSKVQPLPQGLSLEFLGEV